MGGVIAPSAAAGDGTGDDVERVVIVSFLRVRGESEEVVGVISTLAPEHSMGCKWIP
jgi:hypothetical protein